MAEVPPAGIDFRIPIVGKLDQRRLGFLRFLGIARRSEENQGIAPFLVIDPPRFHQPELADEEIERGVEIGDADHGVQEFHCFDSVYCFKRAGWASRDLAEHNRQIGSWQPMFCFSRCDRAR